jgi:hypothetical protein
LVTDFVTRPARSLPIGPWEFVRFPEVVEQDAQRRIDDDAGVRRGAAACSARVAPDAPVPDFAVYPARHPDTAGDYGWDPEYSALAVAHLGRHAWVIYTGAAFNTKLTLVAPCECGGRLYTAPDSIVGFGDDADHRHDGGGES